MKVQIAEKAGFCFGVDRAVKIAYQLAEEKGAIATYGMLIHNQDVIDDLSRCGVAVIHAPEEVLPGMQVIIRAHGIGQKEQDALIAAGACVVDATCPYVKKIHQIVKKAYEEGRTVIICGDGAHPEVQGINGWCENTAIVIQREEELEQISSVSVETPVTVVAQTTIRKPFFKKI
ncbi:MAG: bifunctional 4-hydroxy-3-methylbut-2-enyl diphosphate reductase/30S ribosomal protein S1, partial [Clostridia bacterium]|nr:bifunctional 4-hydroxy-3-methylbut-2-enyl diphosphate reductase/30S ribosomal protein S1 [Clostridia bacterium]